MSRGDAPWGADEAAAGGAEGAEGAEAAEAVAGAAGAEGIEGAEGAEAAAGAEGMAIWGPKVLTQRYDVRRMYSSPG